MENSTVKKELPEGCQGLTSDWETVKNEYIDYDDFVVINNKD